MNNRFSMMHHGKTAIKLAATHNLPSRFFLKVHEGGKRFITLQSFFF